MKFFMEVAALAAVLAFVAPLPVKSQNFWTCPDVNPPFGPAKYDSMPGENPSEDQSYAQFPYQEAEPDTMFCNLDPDTFNDPDFDDERRYFHTHWSEMHPTKILPRSEAPINTIPKVKDFDRHKKNIDALEGFKKANDEYRTDALLVIHKGKIYYEHYEKYNSPMQHHFIWSMTKSYVGIVAAMLAAEGRLDPSKPITYYLPGLKNTNPNTIFAGLKDNTLYDDMTVRHVMDMSSATSYQESFAGLISFGGALHNAGNGGGIGYRNTPLWFGRKDANYTHGHMFEYKSLDTQILGMVVDSPKVLGGNGKLIEYFNDNIWSKLGQENSFNINVDWQHAPLYAYGSMVTLRDAGRFGLMMLNDGKSMDGKQLVPKEVVRDILNGGTDENLAQMSNNPIGKVNFDAYRNQFWVLKGKAGKVFSQIGVRGQFCYVDFENDVVIARFGSHTVEQDIGAITQIFDPIIDYLKEEGGSKKKKKGKKKGGKNKAGKKDENRGMHLDGLETSNQYTN